MDGFSEFFGATWPAIDRIGAVGTLIVIAILVIRDKLVWHTRLEKSEARADRWENVALVSLREGAQAGIKAAEAAVDVVSAMPNPQGDRDKAERGADK